MKKSWYVLFIIAGGIIAQRLDYITIFELILVVVSSIALGGLIALHEENDSSRRET